MRVLGWLIGQIPGVVFGVLASLIASYAWSEYDAGGKDRKLIVDVAKEINARMFSAHQASITAFDPVRSLEIVKDLYESTRSATDNDVFEGKRLENLTYILASKSRDESVKMLAERIKFLTNDFPIEFTFQMKDKDEMSRDSIFNNKVIKIQEKLSDYACCVKDAFGVEGGASCSSDPNYNYQLRHCIFKEKILIPPRGAQLELLRPFEYQVRPEFYK